MSFGFVLAAESVNDKRDLYPHASELVFGAIAFAVLFAFMWRWVLPRINQMLEERRTKIQGQLEEAEHTRTEADRILEEYRQKLAGAREDANRIVEEARRSAEELRLELQGRAETEANGIVSRAQEEIRAERDRVFQELRTQVADIAVELAGRVVGRSLDRSAHERLIDEYIDQVQGSGNGSGTGEAS